MPVNSQTKWKLNLNTHGIDSDIKWNDVYAIPCKCTIDTKLQSLQFKINHGFLSTGYALFKMGLKDDSRCTLCDEATETIFHLFVECEHTKRLWAELQRWLLEVARYDAQWSASEILFGVLHPNSTLINHAMLITKQYIYNATISHKRLSFIALKNIKGIFKVECYIAKTNFKTDNFFRKWAPLYNHLNT